MAAFKPATASLRECYNHIEEINKTTPSLVKRIQSLVDFSEFSSEYTRLVCRTPGVPVATLDMVKNEADVLIIQNHPPFFEKRGYGLKGMTLDRFYMNQLKSMMPSDMSYEVTSLVKGMPSEFKKKGKLTNRFTQTEMKGWLPYLLHEIDVVKPKVIIAMSSEIVKLLGIKGSNTNNRGEVYISPVCGIPVVITLHPKVLNMIRQNASGGMWGDDYYSVIARDLYKASDLVNERLKLLDLKSAVADAADKQITVCKSIEDVRYWTDFLINISSTAFTSWDLETNSLDPWWRGVNRFGEDDEARIITSQVGYRRKDGCVHSIVIPLWHRDNDYYDPDEAFEIHKEYLLRDSCKVGHNISFDICFLAATTGVRLRGTIIDTMLALHSMDSGIKGCYGLKTSVWDYLLESGLGGYESLLMIEEEEHDEDDD